MYQYDALHRIRKSLDYRYDAVAGQWTKAQDGQVGNNNTEYTYDPNGNIKTLKRRANGILVDDFNYSYLVNGDGRLTTNNRLNNIKDNSLTTHDGYLNNGDHPFATDAYDAIGNITKNGGDGISQIEWNVQNKISKVISLKGTTTYTYDASGNRLTKAVKIGTQGDENTTVYVRDATGNVLSVYKKETTNAVYYQKEVYLYGSSRIGVHNFEPIERKLSDPAPIALQATRGKKFFELSNHLGNVLTTITDQKLWRTEGGNSFYVATVVNASDYHPFGLAVKSRTFGSDKYRFGFNGKENDESWGSELIQDYGMRIYSPSIDRFLSVDPIGREYPELTPYQFASNSPILMIDIDGLEGGLPWYLRENKNGGKPVLTLGLPNLPLVNRYEGGIAPTRFATNVARSAYNNIANTWNEALDGKTGGAMLTETSSTLQDFTDHATYEDYKRLAKDVKTWENLGGILLTGYLTRRLTSFERPRVLISEEGRGIGRPSLPIIPKLTVKESAAKLKKLLERNYDDADEGTNLVLGDDMTMQPNFDAYKQKGVLGVHAHGFEGSTKMSMTYKGLSGEFGVEFLANIINTEYKHIKEIQLFMCNSEAFAKKLHELTGKKVSGFNYPLRVTGDGVIHTGTVNPESVYFKY